MSGGVWPRRRRAGLVVAEIAVTIVLTIGAALLIRSFARLQQVSPGFDADRALAAELPLSGAPGWRSASPAPFSPSRDIF